MASCVECRTACRHTVIKGNKKINACLLMTFDFITSCIERAYFQNLVHCIFKENE